MEKREHYHTKQKDLVLDEIRKKKYEFTVKELHDDMQKEVGLTTIYRLVDLLVNDGRLNKYIGKDNITYYQYLEKCPNENHFYLKCDVCGSLIHVDCDCIKELSRHIIKNHRFRPTKDKFMIHGICENCSKGELL